MSRGKVVPIGTQQRAHGVNVLGDHRRRAARRNEVTYAGRYVDPREIDELVYAPPTLPGDDDPCEDDAHYVEARPRHDAEGRALIIIECTVCGWEVVVTDAEGFIAPSVLMDIARRHYLALTKGHAIDASEVVRYGLQSWALIERGVTILEDR